MSDTNLDDYLIDPEQLNGLLGRVFLIDTRDPEEYRKAHIPGAVNLRDIFTYLCTRESGGYPAMAAHFSGLLGKAGLTAAAQVVIYENAMDNGYGQSCRGWFLLKYLGHASVRVLHGGYRAWQSSGYAVDDQIVLNPAIPYQPHLNENLMVTTEQMLAAIDDPSIQIVDVRDYAEWIGANSSPYGYDYCPRKGHIPNAYWLEWYQMMTHHNRIPWFRSSEDILQAMRDRGIQPDKPIYLYCFKGARTSNTLLALKRAGVPDVRNYFMSWNEWSRHDELPIEESY